MRSRSRPRSRPRSATRPHRTLKIPKSPDAVQALGMRAGIVVNVTREDRRRLEAIVSDRSAPQKHVWRAQIILATADGCGTAEIMRRSGKAKPVVWTWQARFMAEGVDGLLRDKTRKPGKAPLPAETVQLVIGLVTGPPPGEATHWTGRMLAKAAGVSLRSVQRILEAHQLAPHRVRTFKLSNDPKFAAKLRDIVGLYINPPAHAVVLSVDEKSQIQALDRTQPGLPMKPGRPLFPQCFHTSGRVTPSSWSIARFAFSNAFSILLPHSGDGSPCEAWRRTGKREEIGGARLGSCSTAESLRNPGRASPALTPRQPTGH